MLKTKLAVSELANKVMLYQEQFQKENSTILFATIFRVCISHCHWCECGSCMCVCVLVALVLQPLLLLLSPLVSPCCTHICVCEVEMLLLSWNSCVLKVNFPICKLSETFEKQFVFFRLLVRSPARLLATAAYALLPNFQARSSQFLWNIILCTHIHILWGRPPPMITWPRC